MVKRKRASAGPIGLGNILHYGDGICIGNTGPWAILGGLIEFLPKIGKGIILSLNSQTTDMLLLGDLRNIIIGTLVKPLGSFAKINVSPFLFNSVIDPIGNILACDKNKNLYSFFPLLPQKKSIFYYFSVFYNFPQFIEIKAPGIIKRKKVNQPLYTGLLSIDMLLPIGRGQRQLILGDRKTGKSEIAIDAIISQYKFKTKVFCIYVLIGQQKSLSLQIYNKLKNYSSLNNTIVISANSDDLAAIQYLAPYVGVSVAEYWTNFFNKDTLIIYDDLSKHAIAYRQLSLLLKRPVGREAYPADIFYLHSKLLERSGKFQRGSITALPIIEILNGDISSYIPTNVISITDGQVILEFELFNKGFRPAINISLSVSRVGSMAQIPFMGVSSYMRSIYAQYKELEKFIKFGLDNLDKLSQTIISKGRNITNFLVQQNNNPFGINLKSYLLFWFGSSLNIKDYFSTSLLKLKITKFEDIIKKLKISFNDNINLLVLDKTNLNIFISHILSFSG